MVTKRCDYEEEMRLGTVRMAEFFLCHILLIDSDGTLERYSAGN